MHPFVICFQIIQYDMKETAGWVTDWVAHTQLKINKQIYRNQSLHRPWWWRTWKWLVMKNGRKVNYTPTTIARVAIPSRVNRPIVWKHSLSWKFNKTPQDLPDCCHFLVRTTRSDPDPSFQGGSMIFCRITFQSHFWRHSKKKKRSFSWEFLILFRFGNCETVDENMLAPLRGMESSWLAAVGRGFRKEENVHLSRRVSSLPLTTSLFFSMNEALNGSFSLLLILDFSWPVVLHISRVR